MGSWARLLRLKRTRVWAMVLAAVAGGLCLVPLFNVLGYEFALVLALAVSLAGAHLGSVVVAELRQGDAALVLGTRSGPGALTVLLGQAVAVVWTLLVIPLALIGLNALRVRNCAPLQGLAMFALLPLGSAAIAAGCGTLWAVALPRRWLATAASLLTVCASLGWGLWRFYAEPPVAAYDPFLGYFAGSIYDDNIVVRAPLLWARLYHLCGVGMVAALAATWLDPGTLRLQPRWRRPAGAAGWALVAGLLLAGATAWLGARAAALGFAVDSAQIEHALGGRLRTAHFDIVYPSKLSAARAWRMVEDHEFRYAQLAATFGSAPPRIRSFVFADAAQKRRLLGSGRVLIAKPWRAEIYLEAAAFPHPQLKHELAHLFAAEHGDSLLGLSLRWRPGASGGPLPRLNVGLVEGVAIAADWPPYGEMDGHQRAAALVTLGLAPPLDQVFGLAFWTHAGARSYTVAGSFCRHLMQRHGMRKLLAAHRAAGDFEAIYGAPLDELGRRWTRWVERVSLPGAQLKLAEQRLRRPGVFRRVCAHTVAHLRDRAAALNRRGQHARAAELLARVCAFDPGTVGHAIARFEALVAAGQRSAAVALAQQTLRRGALSDPQRRQLLERLGDLHWLRARQLEPARASYRRAARLAAAAGPRRVLTLKRLALRHEEPVRSLLMRYLVTPPGRKRSASADMHLAHRIARAWPASGIGPYLVGKQLAAHDRPADAVGPLRRALRLELPDRDFLIEALRVLGQSAYRAGDDWQARRAFEKLRDVPDLPAGIRLMTQDWLARIAWRYGA